MTDQLSSNSDQFIRVASVGDFGQQSQMVFELNGRMLLLIFQKGNYYCIDDVCTHDGGTLSDGELEEGCIVCPRHGAKFSILTGTALTMPATEPTGSYPVKCIGQDIYVSVPQD